MNGWWRGTWLVVVALIALCAPRIAVAQSTSELDRLLAQIREYVRDGKNLEATPLVEQVVAEVERER